MAVNKSKPDKFVWKHRSSSNIESDAIQEIKNNINSFNYTQNCNSHNLSDLSDNLSQLETCINEKLGENIDFYITDLSENFDDVQVSRFDDLCDNLRQDKNTTAYDNVELTAHDDQREANNSAQYSNDRYNYDGAVNTPAGWSADNSGAYRVSVQSSDYDTVYVPNYGTDNDSQACTGYFASDGCTSVYFSKFSLDNIEHIEISNTDKAL